VYSEHRSDTLLIKSEFILPQIVQIFTKEFFVMFVTRTTAEIPVTNNQSTNTQ